MRYCAVVMLVKYGGGEFIIVVNSSCVYGDLFYLFVYCVALWVGSVVIC